MLDAPDSDGSCALRLAGGLALARPSGALWLPAARLLVVSDLHLGKAERLARRGGALLPPYETEETLARLAAEVDALGPATVLCLGDSFDDLRAAEALDEAARETIARLAAGRRWVWAAGNHDPAPLDLPGTHAAEWREGPFAFRHIAARAPRRGRSAGITTPRRCWRRAGGGCGGGVSWPIRGGSSCRPSAPIPAGWTRRTRPSTRCSGRRRGRCCWGAR
jgi:DNA ligase-associated metallophosphoesterase